MAFIGIVSEQHLNSCNISEEHYQPEHYERMNESSFALFSLFPILVVVVVVVVVACVYSECCTHQGSYGYNIICISHQAPGFGRLLTHSVACSLARLPYAACMCVCVLISYSSVDRLL